MNTLLATLPIFLIIAAGYCLTRMHIAKNKWMAPLNSLVYYIALPALIIVNLIKLDVSTSSLHSTLIVSVIVASATTLIFAGLCHFLPFNKKTRMTIFLTAILGNAIFLGIPLAEALTPSLAKTTVATVSVVFFTATLISSLVILEIWLYKSKNGGHIIESLVKNPIIIALAIGLLLTIIPVPQSLLHLTESPLQLLAQTASPLALFALGGFLANRRPPTQIPAIIIATALKLLILPFLFLATSHTLPLTDTSVELQILLAATPTAVTAFVLTEKYKLNNELAAGVMLISTVLSVFTIPIVMSFI